MRSKFTYRNKWILFTAFIILLCCTIAKGQLSSGSNTYINWQAFPINYQFFPRNASNQGTFTIIGTFKANVSDANIRLYRNNVKIFEKKLGAGPVSFNETITINSELATYDLRLEDGNNWRLNAEDLVAGDAYFIQGQSNAEARPMTTALDTANNDPIGDRNYVRVYGGAKDNYTKQWFIADANNNAFQDGNIGQFGMRIAKRIVSEQGIPVCILNGAERDFYIDQFLRNDANHTDISTNYGRELTRANEAGLTGSIKALIWFQGEGNSLPGRDTSRVNYKTKFNLLYSDWEEDYGLMSKYYMIQVRPGCDEGNSTPTRILPIQEAQRELDIENPIMEIVSTNNLPKYTDNCHYYYAGGYREIGDRVFTLIKRDFYGGTALSNDLTPIPTQVEFSALQSDGVANEITISFQTPGANLVISGEDATNKIKDLILLKNATVTDGSAYNITSVNIVNTLTLPSVNNVLKISFTRNGAQPNPTGLTFISKNPYNPGTSPTIITGNNIGLINFDNFPLGLGILPTDPLNLRINANAGANKLLWTAEDNPRFSNFIIQRSDDGNTFSDIAKVAGNNANGTANYEYTDTKPNSIRNYYRIKAVKLDGRSLFSQVVAVNNRTSSTIGITVYPNPVTDRANISVKVKKAGAANIQIYDGAGRMVATRKITLQKGNNMFSAGEVLDQGAGIYNIRVVTEEEVFNARIVRVK